MIFNAIIEGARRKSCSHQWRARSLSSKRRPLAIIGQRDRNRLALSTPAQLHVQGAAPFGIVVSGLWFAVPAGSVRRVSQLVPSVRGLWPTGGRDPRPRPLAALLVHLCSRWARGAGSVAATTSPAAGTIARSPQHNGHHGSTLPLVDRTLGRNGCWTLGDAKWRKSNVENCMAHLGSLGGSLGALDHGIRCAKAPAVSWRSVARTLTAIEWARRWRP